MKKTLLMILGLLMLMSVSSFATQTRTMVMGDNHMVLVDDANIFMFPGRINNYPNLALGEFSYGDQMYQFGVTWQFNDDNPWVLGTFVSTEPGYGPNNFWGSSMADFDELSSNDARRLQLIYGRQLGGNNFGFSLEAVRFSEEYTETDYNPKESFGQYTFMLGLTEATSGQWDMSLLFMTGSWTAEDGDGEKITEPSGFYDMALGGRYFMVRNPKVTMVPHVGIMMGKRGYEHHEGTPDDATDNRVQEWTRTAFEVGMGMNYTPAPNMLAVFDIGVQYEKIKEDRSGGYYADDQQGELSDTWFSFPYFKIGFEGEVFSWMDVRAGATASLWTSKYTEESKIDEGWKWTWDYSDNDTYFGFGFNWNRLYIDTYTDPQLLLQGLDFISGSSDYYGSDPMNWQVSLLYEMF
jgi:hypothetical protein